MENKETKDADPIIVWNDLTKENVKQEIVSAMYLSMSKSTTIIDKFSLWLLAGTGATGALLITQVSSVLPYLSLEGFQVCIYILVASALFGFFAKYRSIQCEIQVENLQYQQDNIVPIFNNHANTEKEISKLAPQAGVQVETGLDVLEIMHEFLKPFPSWIK